MTPSDQECHGGEQGLHHREGVTLASVLHINCFFGVLVLERLLLLSWV